MITTIITTYKRPQLLKRAVASVLAQTYPHFQVCVYDNASGDETEAVMHEFMKKDPRVKYHRHPENIGMMPNYAFGYSRINTPYFSFLSDDDYLLPNFYETALDGFRRHPDAAFSACGIVAQTEEGKERGNPLSFWNREGYFSVPEGVLEMIKARWHFPIPNGILFQHNIVKDVPPDFCPEITLVWDPDYLLQISARFPIVITRKLCGVFVVHDASYSSEFYLQLHGSTKKLNDYLVATQRMFNRFKTIPDLAPEIKEQMKAVFETMLRGEIHRYMCRELMHLRPAQAIFIAEAFNKHYEDDTKVKILRTAAVLCHRSPPLHSYCQYAFMDA